jgi:leader peptidase (prepilin peptidase)/N-methyltransferase
MDVSMILLVLRLIVVFAVGVSLGSIVNWAVDTFAWLPRPARRTGIRSLLLRIGLGVTLAWLYWWEVVRFGLIRDQLGGIVVVPPNWTLHLEFVSHALLICWMLAASFIDIDEKIIPDEITVTGTLLGLILAAIVPMSLLPSVAPRAAAPAGLSSVPLLQPAGGQAVGPMGISLWLEPMTPVSPNEWPPKWGQPREWESLSIGLACYWLWCFALAPRIWRGRRGPLFALRLIGARLRREFARPPMRLLFVAGTVAIVCVWAFGASAWAGLLTALIGLVASGGIVWAVRLIGTAALGREAMGFGDVTLMMMIGTFLGWQASLITFFVAPFAALIVGIIQFVARRDDVIPYGPFLCMAAAGVIIYWGPIWMWAQPMFEHGALVPLVLIVCLILLGFMLAVWRMIKVFLFGDGCAGQ